MNTRVFEKSSGRFGTIVKSSGVLGLKDSITVAFDDGRKGAFFGKSLDGVVPVDASLNQVDLVGAWKSDLEEEHCAGLVKAYLALDWAKATKRSRAKFKV